MLVPNTHNEQCWGNGRTRGTHTRRFPIAAHCARHLASAGPRTVKRVIKTMKIIAVRRVLQTITMQRKVAQNKSGARSTQSSELKHQLLPTTSHPKLATCSNS